MAVSIDRLDDRRHLAGAKDNVDFGNLALQFVAVALGQTSGHDQPAARPIFLVLCHLQNGVDGFLLRPVDERAGVDHDHVGARRVGGKLVAGALGQAEHHLGVDKVLGAAEGNQSDFHSIFKRDDSLL